MLGKVMSG